MVGRSSLCQSLERNEDDDSWERAEGKLTAQALFKRLEEVPKE